MIKTLLAALILTCTLPLLAPAVASAHELKFDGNMGAVLHFNPDDNPTTGAPTDFLIFFNDETGKFKLSGCDCSVTFLKDGRAIDTEQLVLSTDQISDNHYTFTEPAVYSFHVVGTPKVADSFQPFTLDYEVRIAGGKIISQPIPPLLWAGFSMLIGLILLAAYKVNKGGIK